MTDAVRFATLSFVCSALVLASGIALTGSMQDDARTAPGAREVAARGGEARACSLADELPDDADRCPAASTIDELRASLEPDAGCEVRAADAACYLDQFRGWAMHDGWFSAPRPGDTWPSPRGFVPPIRARDP